MEYKIIAIAPWNLYQSLPHKKGVAKVTSFGLALSASFDILNISRGFTRKKDFFIKGPKNLTLMRKVSSWMQLLIFGNTSEMKKG